MGKRVTMTDVAKAAGVHQTTVSLALRGHRSIPSTTCDRIRAIATKMGYRPNPLISALISERRRNKASGYGETLAFLTAYTNRYEWRASHNYELVYKALGTRADELGYRVEEFWYSNPDIPPARLQQILLARGIRGIIVCPLPYGVHELDFDFSDFAAVSIGYTLKSPSLDRVSVNFFGITQLAIQKLREMGCQRIGFISAPTIDDRVNHLSMGAFLAEKQADPNRLISPLIAYYGDLATISAWIDRERPDAIIASVLSEYLALGTYLNDHFKSRRKRPLLCVVDAKIDGNETGVVQDLDAEARAAIDLVTSRVERAHFGPQASPQTILVGGHWRCPRDP
jgi:DNA-binding LacI/PurR family transcriptional regulator